MRTFVLSKETLETFKDIPVDLFVKENHKFKAFIKAGAPISEFHSRQEEVPESFYVRIEDFQNLIGYPIEVAKTPMGRSFLIPPEERQLAFTKLYEAKQKFTLLGVAKPELEKIWCHAYAVLVTIMTREDISPHLEPLLLDLPLSLAQGIESGILAAYIIAELGYTDAAELQEIILAAILSFVGASMLEMQKRDRQFDEFNAQNIELFMEKFEYSNKLISKMAVSPWTKSVAGKIINVEFVGDRANRSDERIKHWALSFSLELVHLLLPPGVLEPSLKLKTLFLEYYKEPNPRYPQFFLNEVKGRLYIYDREAS